MKITLKNIKPLALNNSHKITTRGRFASKYKTKECIQYESEIERQLRSYSKDFTKLNNSLDEKNTYLSVKYEFNYNIMTKNGTISKKSNDVDNCIKVLQDVLFRNIILDDSFILEIHAIKRNSTSEFIDITIKSHIY